MNKSRKMTIKSLALLTFLAVLVLNVCILWVSSCRRSDTDSIRKSTQYYPVYIDQPFTIPDSLPYFYNTVYSTGIALSGGEFSVLLKYPVFRSEDKKIEKLVDWLDDEVFILAHNGNEDNETISKRFQGDYPGYANYTLNSWLATEETTKLGCMQESLSVEIVLNSEIITMKVHHKGYWGGANGDDNVHYAMFDKNFNQIEIRSLIELGKQDELNQMLIAEYNRNIVPWRDSDDNYKLNPDNLALIPEGLITVYSGYAHAEGQPTMLIKSDKFMHLLKPQYRSIYDAK